MSKNATRFPVIEMSGSHYDMGRQYGTQCRELIRELQAKFDRLILKGDNVEAAKAVARGAVPHVREAAPGLIDEVQGIADGAGLDFDDVFRMNCSVEVFAWQGCIESQAVNTVPTQPDGCSSFALRAKEGTLVAWNMDWWTLWQPYIVLLHGRPDDGPAFYAFAFAGCVGRPGMSEHVAVAANYLSYRGGMAPGKANQWEGPGVPYGFLSRIILKQRSTADAVAAIAGVRRMAGLNYTIGDAAGDIRCIETTPLDFAELRPEDISAADGLRPSSSGTGPTTSGSPESSVGWAVPTKSECGGHSPPYVSRPEDGAERTGSAPETLNPLPHEPDYLTHANSFFTAKFGGIAEPQLQASDPRTAHAREQLRDAARPLDRHALMRVMTSHFPNDTSGICVHRQLQDKPGISLLSFIANVGKGRMWAAMGPPCEHAYVEYGL